jgi:hypothetical protein
MLAGYEFCETKKSCGSLIGIIYSNHKKERAKELMEEAHGKA